MSTQKPRSAHKSVLERTNMGYFFSDCECGAHLGVYHDRASAKWRHELHVKDVEGVDDE